MGVAVNPEVFAHESLPMSEAPFEVVERKGRGHPDTICDLLAEQISCQLTHFYLQHCGRVLHFNVDKALLVGGRSEPHLGGGKIIEPAKFYLGDRAISTLNGQHFDLDGVIEEAISRWLEDNLRFLRREGAAALNRVEDGNLSNDTSVGVGFWPLSPLEETTLAAEDYMNSLDFKTRHPASGEDIKVMSIRRGKPTEIVIACALVDRFVSDVQDCDTKKAAILGDVSDFLNAAYAKEYRLSVALNALDDPVLGADGLYLTVTGLSCEGGDSGEVGRGNRVNKLISFLRPQTMEAWAGKNSKSHVGKIYSFAAESLARKMTEAIPEVTEAMVLLVGKIGSRVDRPAHVFAEVKIRGDRHSAVRAKAAGVLNEAMGEGAMRKTAGASRESMAGAISATPSSRMTCEN
jgi:S-adenosylmethionine synthetase